jgi:hypothetical protein
MTWWKRSVGASVAWVLAAIGPAFGIDPPTVAPAAPMVTKVFDVTELVCVPGDFKPDARGGHSSSAPSDAVCADRLVSNITAMIAPGTWACDGGAGRIEYCEKGHTLEVRHSPRIVEQIGTALERLTARVSTTVAFTTQMIRVPAGTLDAALAGIETSTPSGGIGCTHPLTPDQLRTVLVECLASNAARTRQLPKLTCLNGQSATIADGERKRVDHTRVYTLTGGMGYAIPATDETFLEGTSLRLCPIVAADRKTVRVQMKWETTSAMSGMITVAEGQKVEMETYLDGKPAGTAEVTLTAKSHPRAIKSCVSTVTLQDGHTCLVDLGVCQQGDGKQRCLLLMTAMVQADETGKAPRSAPVVTASPVVQSCPNVPGHPGGANHYLVTAQPVMIPAPPVAVVAPMPSAVPPPAATASYPYHPVASPPVRPAEGAQVYTQLLLFKTTLDGAMKHGLTDAQTLLNETQFESLRAEFAKKTRFEVLSAPQMMLLDRQVGYFLDGMADGSHGETIRVTPTFSADQKFVRLKLEADCAGHGKPCCDVEMTLPDGGTACHGLKPKTGEQSNDERMFLVVTPRFVRTPEDKTCVAVACCTGEAPVMPPPPHAVQPPTIPSQGVALSALGYQRIDSTPADRKAKAAVWVAAYEKACAGAKGPSPAECALRALAEDPHCFVRPAGQ